MRACAIILAAGSARRMDIGQNKVFLKFDEQSAVVRCLKTFIGSGLFASVIVACRPFEMELLHEKIEHHIQGGNCILCEGGNERQYSVQNALAYVPEDTDYIAVHDAARCFVTPEIIEGSLLYAKKYGSGVTAIRATDTVKRVKNDVIEETLDRSELVLVQTPQTFKADLLKTAYEKARQDGFLGTDDASLVERLGVQVHTCPGSVENIKLTVKRDIEEGERILDRRRVADTIHAGTGFDVHAFCAGRPLVLGGVNVPSERGLDGHSDADVLVHAIMDALLGAAGLPDIGCLFPDTDPKYKDCSSLGLLAQVGAKIREEGFSVSNIDSTVLMEKPKIASYTHEMAANIADVLGILPEQVSVKATTTEKLGALGREEGAAAQAVCLLKRRSAYV